MGKSPFGIPISWFDKTLSGLVSLLMFVLSWKLSKSIFDRKIPLDQAICLAVIHFTACIGPCAAAWASFHCWRFRFSFQNIPHFFRQRSPQKIFSVPQYLHLCDDLCTIWSRRVLIVKRIYRWWWWLRYTVVELPQKNIVFIL